MMYVALGLAIAFAVAGIVAAATAVALKETQKELTAANLKIASMVKDQQALGASANIEVKKREDVINFYKAEITDLEKQLGENKDPAAVRARLGQLLSKES